MGSAFLRHLVIICLALSASCALPTSGSRDDPGINIVAGPGGPEVFRDGRSHGAGGLIAVTARVSELMADAPELASDVRFARGLYLAAAGSLVTGVVALSASGVLLSLGNPNGTRTERNLTYAGLGAVGGGLLLELTGLLLKNFGDSSFLTAVRRYNARGRGGKSVRLIATPGVVEQAPGGWLRMEF